MAIREHISELLERTKSVGTESEVIEILNGYRKYGKLYDNVLKHTLLCFFHPAVIFDLPKGMPDDYVFSKRIKRLDQGEFDILSFVKGRNILRFTTISPKKVSDKVMREKLFFRFIETMYENEAKILVAMKDKDTIFLQEHNITIDVFKAVWPNELPEEETKKLDGIEG